MRKAMAAAALAVMLAPATARADYGITTVAGNGNVGFGGDGGPALAAVFATPIAVAALPGGGYLVADPGNHRVRRVAPDGAITTVAGNGTAGSGGDNGPATRAQLNFPR